MLVGALHALEISYPDTVGVLVYVPMAQCRVFFYLFEIRRMTVLVIWVLGARLDDAPLADFKWSTDLSSAVLSAPAASEQYSGTDRRRRRVEVVRRSRVDRLRVRASPEDRACFRAVGQRAVTRGSGWR